jgi:hypothetical protein
MKINLQEVEYYYLNTLDRRDRRDHVESMLDRFGLIGHRIEGGTTDPSIKALQNYPLVLGCLGHIKAIDQALCSNPFRPFVILEDDVSVTASPGIIEVPSLTDVVYLGVSNAGCQPDINVYCLDIKRTRSQKYKHLLRVYNMLSTHAILFVSLRYAMAYMRAMMEACILNIYLREKTSWDTISTRLSTLYNVYALDKPLFYQDASVGGQENVTLVNWRGITNNVKFSNEVRNYHRYRIFSNCLQQYQNTLTFVADSVTYKAALERRDLKLFIFVDIEKYQELKREVDGSGRSDDVYIQVKTVSGQKIDPSEMVKMAITVNPFLSDKFSYISMINYSEIIPGSPVINPSSAIYGYIDDLVDIL